MSLKTVLQIVLIVILLAIGGVLVYDNFWNQNKIQENITNEVRENPLEGLIFPSSLAPESEEGGTPDFIYEEGGTETENEVGGQEQTTQITSLGYQITASPTAGWTTYIIEEKNEAEETIQKEFIRYVKISDGLISEEELNNPNTKQEIVDRFIPNVERVVFSGDTTKILFQYFNYLIESIETYSGTIEKVIIEPSACPFTFPTRPKVGAGSDEIEDLHNFLNRDTRTQITLEGDEDITKYTEKSDVAVKNFQTIYELDIDGIIGPKTIAQMNSVCAEQQRQIAEEAEANLTEYYSLSGYFLPSNIFSLTKSPRGTEYFYLFEKDNESFGIIGNFSNTNTKQIFQSPLTELDADWINEDEIIVSTKPSFYAPGYIFSLNPNTEEFVKILGGRDGLYGKASRDGKYIFISYISDSNKTINAIYNTETKIENGVLIETLPDKCVWSFDNETLYCGVPVKLLDGIYPDDWYKGVVALEDDLWVVDASSLEATQVSSFKETVGANQIDVDMIDVSSSGANIILRNKIDETLWLIPIPHE